MTVGARCVMVCCTVASQLDKYSHSFVYNSFMMTDNEKPLILISNDDGLQAKGIRFLADGLDGVDAGLEAIWGRNAVSYTKRGDGIFGDPKRNRRRYVPRDAS